MAPDAPSPTFSASGSQLGDFMVSLTYSAHQDATYVVVTSAETPTRRSQRREFRYSGDDIEKALAEVHRHVVALGVRRLF